MHIRIEVQTMLAANSGERALVVVERIKYRKD
jgi:hypothetical protein